MPSYGEQVVAELNTFALNYGSRDIASARSELGLRADKSFMLQTALLTMRGRAAWAHYFDDERSLKNGISLAGVFEGEFSGRTTGYAGKGIVRYEW